MYPWHSHKPRFPVEGALKGAAFTVAVSAEASQSTQPEETRGIGDEGDGNKEHPDPSDFRFRNLPTS